MIQALERSMMSSEPSQRAFFESQKTALQAAMSARSQSQARRRRSAIAYQRQTMEMGLKCGRKANHDGDLEWEGMTTGNLTPPTRWPISGARQSVKYWNQLWTGMC